MVTLSVIKADIGGFVGHRRGVPTQSRSESTMRESFDASEIQLRIRIGRTVAPVVNELSNELKKIGIVLINGQMIGEELYIGKCCPAEGESRFRLFPEQYWAVAEITVAVIQPGVEGYVTLSRNENVNWSKERFRPLFLAIKYHLNHVGFVIYSEQVSNLESEW